jgi:N-acetylmuramoyl-L-alanine amidase
MRIGSRQVKSKQTPNFLVGRKGKSPSVIVLHSTGGSYESAVSWLMNKDSDVSAHYVVSRNGDITQLCDTSDTAFHAGVSRFPNDGVMLPRKTAPKESINRISIGIEMEHVDGHQDWTDEQLTAVVDICELLMNKWQIPISHIVGHKDICIPKGRKIDPQNFPWEEFRRRLTK